MPKRKSKTDEEVPAVIGPNGEEFFVVESIIDKRIKNERNGKTSIEYLVKWHGYPESSNSWEPKASLSMAKVSIALYEQKCRERLEKKIVRKSKAKEKKKVTARKSTTGRHIPQSVGQSTGIDQLEEPPNDEHNFIIEIDGFNGYSGDS